MITGGHIAASYLLGEGSRYVGIPLTSEQIIQIVVVGNIVDIDFLVGSIFDKRGDAHHNYITHTPLGVFLVWTILTAMFQYPEYLLILLLVSLLTHLVLDDIGYWFYKLGVYKSPTTPQINWLYPFTEFHKNRVIQTNKEALKFYFFKSWPVAIFELALILIALVVYLKNYAIY